MVFPLPLILLSPEQLPTMDTQRTINEWKKLSNDCANATSVNIFNNTIDRYLIRMGYTIICWAVDKPMASLSTSLNLFNHTIDR